jgi:hypothetical protein
MADLPIINATELRFAVKRADGKVTLNVIGKLPRL